MLPVLSNQTEVMLEDGYKSLTLVGPQPGHWFTLLATDRECPGDLEVVVAARAEYMLEPDVINIVPSFHNYQDMRTFFTINTRQTFRFHVPAGAWRAAINVTRCSHASQGHACPVELTASADTLPHPGHVANVSCAHAPADTCHLDLLTKADSSHYLTVTSLLHNSLPVSLAVSVHLSGCRDETFTEGAMMVNSINTELLCSQNNRRPLKILFQPSSGQPQLDTCGASYKMSRRTGTRGQLTSWSLPGNHGDKQMIHLGGNDSTTLSLDIDHRDIGGNLVIDIAILTLGAPNEVREVIGCLTTGYRTVPRDNGTHHVCPTGSRHVTVARSGIHREMVYEVMTVMYPTRGTWHLALTSHCSMAGQGRRSLCSSGSVTAVLMVTSGPCAPGCGRYGKCVHRVTTAGLTVMSSCQCFSGYKGPLCNDGTHAQSDYSQLTVTLVLSVTNLSLLPVIMLSLYRRHYTECVVYWVQLVAGCLHHACAGLTTTRCAGHSALLAYTDTLAELVSLWVTVLAMAYLPHNLRSVLHITGGLVIATLAHLQHSLIPASVTMTSLSVMFVSWITFSISSRSCEPSSKFVVLHTIPGLVVAAAGAGLEAWQSSVTSHCVHHITRGAAILLLLPSTVRDCHKTKTSPKMMVSSSMSVASTGSTSSMRKPSSKRPKKDVSVSFKQMTDTDEGEEESVKMDSDHGEDDTKQVQSDESNNTDKLVDSKENSEETNTKL